MNWASWIIGILIASGGVALLQPVIGWPGTIGVLLMIIGHIIAFDAQKENHHAEV